MSFNCVIFDFNGTLFWDTELHNRAWDLFLVKHDIRMSDKDKDSMIHGRNNQEILKMLFGQDLDTGKQNRYIVEKEGIYQDMVLETGLGLAPGVEEFLDFLKSSGVRFTIATASGIENVSFYFDHLKLSRWFDYSKVVFNNGLIKSKPDPEIFLTAMRLLDAEQRGTVIFEDSETGLKAALAAGPGIVIRVNSSGADSYANDLETISHFGEVRREIFCSYQYD